MSRIVDALTLFTTNRKAYVQKPISPILLKLDDSFTDSERDKYTSEYALNVVLGYKFWLSDSLAEELPLMKTKMLIAFAEEFFGEFKPTIRKLFELAYANGDRESIDLLESLEKQMFRINNDF